MVARVHRDALRPALAAVASSAHRAVDSIARVGESEDGPPTDDADAGLYAMSMAVDSYESLLVSYWSTRPGTWEHLRGTHPCWDPWGAPGFSLDADLRAVTFFRDKVALLRKLLDGIRTFEDQPVVRAALARIARTLDDSA